MTDPIDEVHITMLPFYQKDEANATELFTNLGCGIPWNKLRECMMQHNTSHPASTNHKKANTQDEKKQIAQNAMVQCMAVHDQLKDCMLEAKRKFPPLPIDKQ